MCLFATNSLWLLHPEKNFLIDQSQSFLWLLHLHMNIVSTHFTDFIMFKLFSISSMTGMSEEENSFLKNPLVLQDTFFFISSRAKYYFIKISL